MSVSRKLIITGNKRVIKKNIVFFKKSVKKIWKWYLNDAIFAAAIGNQEGWTAGVGEWVWWVGLQFFRLCRVLQDIALVWVWKKTSKISFKKFGSNEKVLTFAAAFRNEADVLKHFDGSVFHLLRMKPAEAFFCGGSEKKFEKKCGKIWRGCVKLFIFASAFAPGSGRVK